MTVTRAGRLVGRHGYRRILALSAVLAGLQASSGVASARDTEPSGQAALDWKLCSAVAKDWPVAGDARTECAELRVPMDYDDPDGRKITIAVSRLKATDPEKAGRTPLVSILGGPGFANIADVTSTARYGLGPLNGERDFIGLDLRGSGYSEHIRCDVKPLRHTALDAPQREVAKAEFDQQAELNKRCTQADPEFARQITPENAARDIDRLRTALGAEKVNFYGTSFTTAVGMAYRSLFDARTERMWLDSIVPPTRHWPTMDADSEAVGKKGIDSYIRWLAQRDADYHLGADKATVRKRLGALRGELEGKPRVIGQRRLDGDWVLEQLVLERDEWDTGARNLVAALKGTTPPRLPDPPEPPEPTDPGPKPPRFGLSNPRSPFNPVEYNAMFCNTNPRSRTFDEVWAAREARRAADPAAGGSALSLWCADWPLDAQASPPRRGASALQLSGHLYEYVTPYAWAEQARDATGGTLLTILDDAHSSLPRTPCAAKAVTFFRTGRTADGTCPGVKEAPAPQGAPQARSADPSRR
ncbi:alpha/beta fold hydrolase [Streptomyces sp. NRRL B-1347]|uniref:alpha/beta fold hydrolase n=1 Tax=Streptomyces sp. NRRL B-1347 TaxID=1476877 RepID=UPI0006922680|nr:alpha/beta fold hydrolase [Streptomyces sp. NRRL B-1347]